MSPFAIMFHAVARCEDVYTSSSGQGQAPAPRRKRVKEPSDAQVHLRAPAAEATAWKAEAAALGITLTDLTRAKMNETSVTVVRVTDPVLVNEIRRIGKNLNQVVHGAHAGWPVTRDALDRALDAVADVMRALLRELA